MPTFSSRESRDKRFDAGAFLLRPAPEVVLELRLGEEIWGERQRLPQADAEVHAHRISPVENARQRSPRHANVLGQLGHAAIPMNSRRSSPGLAGLCIIMFIPSGNPNNQREWRPPRRTKTSIANCR